MVQVRLRLGQRHPVRGNGSDNLLSQDIQCARDSGTRREALDPMQLGHPSLPSRYMPFRSDQPHLTRIERLKAVRLNRNNL